MKRNAEELPSQSECEGCEIDVERRKWPRRRRFVNGRGMSCALCRRDCTGCPRKANQANERTSEQLGANLGEAE